ncbi:MAG: hypothetical protein V4735_03160 [Pseudomonadota bacterium]
MSGKSGNNVVQVNFQPQRLISQGRGHVADAPAPLGAQRVQHQLDEAVKKLVFQRERWNGPILGREYYEQAIDRSEFRQLPTQDLITIAKSMERVLKGVGVADGGRVRVNAVGKPHHAAIELQVPVDQYNKVSRQFLLNERSGP